MLAQSDGPEAIAPPAAAPAPSSPARWIHGPVADLALALCWVPFAAVAASLEPGAPLNAFITAVFLLSFAHQPLTIALVYGDGDQFRLRRGIFSVSPVLFAAAVFALSNFNVVLLAVIGGLWNAEHTLMQRYGLTRIYGRKAGQERGGVELGMLFSFLVFALVWAAADPATPDHLAAVQIGENNRMAVEYLANLRSVAVWLVAPAAAVAVVLVVLWVRAEVTRARAGAANPAKWLYIAATVSLFAFVLVNPIAGLMGYVGAHALEYFVIVHQSLGRRYGDPASGGTSPLARAIRARPGRLGFFAIYIGLIIGIVTALERAGSPILYAVVFFTLGGLHVFYDGFIWKLRRPTVAASLAIPAG